MADGSGGSNFSLAGDLEEVLMFDVTDDFEELLDVQEEITESLSNTEFNQVQRGELENVLSRIATKSFNIPEEYEIASRVLNTISTTENEEKVQSFLNSVREAFTVFYNVQTKDQCKRNIEIEYNFLKDGSTERQKIEEKWDELAGPTTTGILNRERHSRTVLEHILLHFWTVRESKVKQENPHPTARSKPDASELEAIKYHAGWAIKRARDIIKVSCESSNTLVLQRSSTDESEVHVNPQSAMALIHSLGQDEQIGNTEMYNFIVSEEVVPFFVLLHDFTDEYFSQSKLETHGEKVILDCLKAMSLSSKIRVAWEGICQRKYPIEVQVVVLQTVSTMFLKSKQSIIREKLNLKPQKGSLSLRQDLKSKTSKKSKPSQSESNATTTSAIINELQQHFDNPEVTAQCLGKICKGNDPEGELNQLTGKCLTKLLKALGLPALQGKKKSKQISAILSHIRGLSDAPLTIKYPDKVSYRFFTEKKVTSKITLLWMNSNKIVKKAFTDTIQVFVMQQRV